MSGLNIQGWLAALGPYFAVAVNLAYLAYIGRNVQKIEKATNSMKDALVEATAKASDLEGEKRGIVIGRDQIAKETC